MFFCFNQHLLSLSSAFQIKQIIVEGKSSQLFFTISEGKKLRLNAKFKKTPNVYSTYS